MTGYDGRFDTVLDCALFHCFDAEQRARYAWALRRVTTPGAILHLMCFADGDDDGVPGTLPLTEVQVRAPLQDARWSIVELRRGSVTFRAEPVAALMPDLSIPVDEHGRVRQPIWVVRAVRT